MELQTPCFEHAPSVTESASGSWQKINTLTFHPTCTHWFPTRKTQKRRWVEWGAYFHDHHHHHELILFLSSPVISLSTSSSGQPGIHASLMAASTAATATLSTDPSPFPSCTSLHMAANLASGTSPPGLECFFFFFSPARKNSADLFYK